LIQFSTGEQYLALGLHDPATLAQVASAAGYGGYDALYEDYTNLPASFAAPLPRIDAPEDTPHEDSPGAQNSNPQASVSADPVGKAF
jgi:hypothetical protein